jgi:hypothetical protein
MYRLAEDTQHTCLPLRIVEALGEDIRQLGRRSDLNEPHLAILDYLVGEVLPDVNVLGSLTSANEVDTPLDVGYQVLSSNTEVGFL